MEDIARTTRTGFDRAPLFRDVLSSNNHKVLLSAASSNWLKKLLDKSNYNIAVDKCKGDY